MAYQTASDREGIDELIRQFFGIFANTRNASPDWTLIFSICIPETQVVKKESSCHVVYNLTSFIEPRKKILTDGTLTNFEEYETTADTVITNNIAQRHSRYEKHGYLNGQYFSGKGTKFFQFVKTPAGWKISAFVWEDDIV